MGPDGEVHRQRPPLDAVVDHVEHGVEHDAVALALGPADLSASTRSVRVEAGARCSREAWLGLTGARCFLGPRGWAGEGPVRPWRPGP
jgi:hypothetical protein